MVDAPFPPCPPRAGRHGLLVLSSRLFCRNGLPERKVPAKTPRGLPGRLQLSLPRQRGLAPFGPFSHKAPPRRRSFATDGCPVLQRNPCFAIIRLQGTPSFFFTTHPQSRIFFSPPICVHPVAASWILRSHLMRVLRLFFQFPPPRRNLPAAIHCSQVPFFFLEASRHS